MSPHERYRDDTLRVTRPRPGHADLPGAMKYAQRDVRNILERSSARETAVRVAVGSVAKALLAAFDISVCGFVVEVGGIAATRPDLPLAALKEIAANSELFTWDVTAEQEMKALIDERQGRGRYRWRNHRSSRFRSPGRIGQSRAVGQKAGCAAGDGAHEHSGHQGGGSRHRLQRRTQSRFGGT